MNLAIDCGNTQIKVGIFEQTTLQAKHVFATEGDFSRFLRFKKFHHAIISSVAPTTAQHLAELPTSGKIIRVDHRIPLPINIAYDTPDTLGADRIAIACGVAECMPNNNCLAIDAGSCITFDFVDAQATYLGGGISPGMQMRYKAIHTFTPKLPLLRADWPVDLVASSTEGCIQGGVINGVIAEIEGIIDRYVEKFSPIKTVISGGDSRFFVEHVRREITFMPDLVLRGLNKILLYNIEL